MNYMKTKNLINRLAAEHFYATDNRGGVRSINDFEFFY